MPGVVRSTDRKPQAVATLTQLAVRKKSGWSALNVRDRAFVQSASSFQKVSAGAFPDGYVK